MSDRDTVERVASAAGEMASILEHQFTCDSRVVRGAWNRTTLLDCVDRLRAADETLRALRARLTEARKEAEHWRMCACGGDMDEARFNRLPWEAPDDA